MSGENLQRIPLYPVRYVKWNPFVLWPELEYRRQWLQLNKNYQAVNVVPKPMEPNLKNCAVATHTGRMMAGSSGTTTTGKVKMNPSGDAPVLQVSLLVDCPHVQCRDMLLI